MSANCESVMHVIEVNNFDALEQHREAWAALLADVFDCSAVFVNPGWVLEWWKRFGSMNELCVLMLMNNDRLVGIAPLGIWRWPFGRSPVRVLRFIGSGSADHLDFCVHPDFRAAGLPILCEHIQRRMRWHLLDFLDIPEDSENLPVIRSALGGGRPRSALLRAIVCPYLRIGSSPWQAFYGQQRSKSTRKDLERRRRRLGDLGQLQFQRHQQREDIQSVFPKLFELYEKRWEQKYLTISFAGPRERDFYPAMALDFARQGRLDLVTLELDGRVLAFSLGVLHNHRFTWLITAHDPDYAKYFPGELMLVQVLESVFNRGDIEEFDFTRGEESYKYKWADSERYNMRLLVTRPSLFGLLPFVTIIGYARLRREAKKSRLLRYVKLELLGRLLNRKPPAQESTT